MKLKANYRPSLLGLQSALSDAKRAVDAAAEASLESGPEVDIVAGKLIERALEYAHTYDKQYFTEAES
jgi:hypothetical protein